MKIIHVPFCFYPDPSGGTEVYVDSLAREQRQRGFEVLVAAPGSSMEAYSHDGLGVRRFPVTATVTDITEMYSEGDRTAAEAFGRILDEERPALVHLHAFTRGASLRLVREAKRRGIQVVFNYHTPTVSCQRGTLLRWGSEICDGVLDVKTCAQCTLHGLGLNRTSINILGMVPSGIGRLGRSAGLNGGLWTALRMTELVEHRMAAFRALMREVDHVVAVCEWVRVVLLANGVAPGKITVSRQGLCHPEESPSPVTRLRSDGSRLRVAFFGRLDPTKGLHILLRALAGAPSLPVGLDIYGVAQTQGGEEYLGRLRRLAGEDARVTFREPVPAEQIVTRMRSYDVLAVPSQCLETGPMVVLEAFAAGLPVIGSKLGGIAELVTDGVNGLLVETQEPVSWGNALERLWHHQGLLGTLRAGIRPPRRLSDVASEIGSVYARLRPADFWPDRDMVVAPRLGSS